MPALRKLPALPFTGPPFFRNMFTVFKLTLIAVSFFIPRFALAQQGIPQRPNVIVVNCDDLGWAEVSCYGSPWKTPNIDKIAARGVKFTSFYSGNPFCTPSRAALLTGSYASRAGFREVLFPEHEVGLNPAEFTMAEMFKQAGYKTSLAGKWHLGSRAPFMPLDHGFDEFYGIPYSHDMSPRIAKAEKAKFPELPLYNGNKKVDEIKDFGLLTGLLTRYSVDFIRKNAGSPFFLMLAHPMPHTPLAVSEKFKDISGQGLIGDVIVEIDWSIGEIVKTLEQSGLLNNTLLIFTSDNGSPRDNHAPGPFRAGKGSGFEGGSRVPFLISWPAVLPKGKVNEGVASQMDLLPTFAKMLNTPLSENTIDGVDIWDLLMCRTTTTSRQQLFFFVEEQPQSLRVGNWKYHVPHLHKDQSDGIKLKGGGDKAIGESLFDLGTDVREQHNVIDKYPVVADSLRMIFQSWQKKFYMERRNIGTVNH